MAQTNKLQIVKYAPPPSELPVYGGSSTAEVSFIGRTNYVAALEEKKFVFGIKRADRRRHLYIIGKSGVGKSKLQELLIRQDIAYGHGVCIIDPHGDIIEDILNFIPEKRLADVCLIDPTDTAFPVSFNPFHRIDPEFKHQFTQNFVELLQAQFKAAWTPRLEHVLRFTVLALLDYPEATLSGIVQMLTDETYRQLVTGHSMDEMVRRFWHIEFKEWAEKNNTDTIIPIINKLTQFFSSSALRNIFSQHENKIDFEMLMNEKKIVLINLAQEKIGEENASFLGSMILSKIKEAGMNRARIGRDKAVDFYLYLDEFENIITESFDSFLASSRKYGINLTLAHQYLAQLSKSIQHAVLSNAGSLVVFRVGGEDATILKPEFAPLFDVKDMINLAIGEFYIKMAIDGESYDPFSAETLKVLPAPYPSIKERVLEESRKKYSVPLA
jgi:type IV secretory pathway TraG/TraD family ATPase VirD4